MNTQRSQALDKIRICDFTGQLAGAGATKILAAFGAEVIRIEAVSYTHLTLPTKA